LCKKLIHIKTYVSDSYNVLLLLHLLGPLSIAIPGEVKGYIEAHRKFGKLTWKELVDPTVELCDEGFEMSKHMEDSITINPIIVHDEYLK
jgi:gamma-glutamyltranspeptidase / glutathione hydrolase / leukotriene-C4 hydrolase